MALEVFETQLTKALVLIEITLEEGIEEEHLKSWDGKYQHLKECREKRCQKVREYFLKIFHDQYFL